jgi:hypothetical protein
MASSYKYSKSVQAKLKRLEKLAHETAKLSVEVFEDIILGHSVPVPPKPKKFSALAMHSIPVPPKPKLEALADLAYGAGTIEDAAGVLGK